MAEHLKRNKAALQNLLDVYWALRKKTSERVFSFQGSIFFSFFDTLCCRWLHGEYRQKAGHRSLLLYGEKVTRDPWSIVFLCICFVY